MSVYGHVVYRCVSLLALQSRSAPGVSTIYLFLFFTLQSCSWLCLSFLSPYLFCLERVIMWNLMSEPYHQKNTVVRQGWKGMRDKHDMSNLHVFLLKQFIPIKCFVPHFIKKKSCSWENYNFRILLSCFFMCHY